MKKRVGIHGVCAFGLSILCFSQNSWSGIDLIDFADTETSLKLGGAVRGKYVYDYISEPHKSKLTFSDIILKLDYDSPTLIGHLDYRFYEYYGKLGNPNWLTDAWLGTKIGDNQRVTAGLSPVPFGVGRYWGSTFYSGIENTMGLEDVHNLGVHYNYNNQKHHVDLAYYPTDGGTYKGNSKDSARFSINMVKADPYVEDGTSTEEKNMLVTRYQYQFLDNPYVKDIGISYWHSEVKNHHSDRTGDKNVFAVHGDLELNHLNAIVVLGYQNIDHKDPIYPKHITLGGFDDSFNMATEGSFYSVDLSYPLKNNFYALTSIKPYLNISGYFDKNDGFADSHRIIPGVSFDFKALTVQAEYLIGKNDPYLGDAQGLAGGGDNKWKRKVYISLAHYF